MKIGMYVHFGHTKKCAQFFLKNCPKWPKFENGLKLEYARKNPFLTERLVTFMIDSFWTERWNKNFKTPFFSISDQNTAKMP